MWPRVGAIRYSPATPDFKCRGKKPFIENHKWTRGAPGHDPLASTLWGVTSFAMFFYVSSQKFRLPIGLDSSCNITNLIIPLLWLSNMEFTHNSLSFFRIFSLLCESMIKENVTSASSDIGDSVSTLITHLDEVSIGLFSQHLNRFLGLSLEFSVWAEINFCQYYNKWFCLE